MDRSDVRRVAILIAAVLAAWALLWLAWGRLEP